MSCRARSSSSYWVSAQVRMPSCPSWRLQEAPCAGQLARRTNLKGLHDLAMLALHSSHALNPKGWPYAESSMGQLVMICQMHCF